MKFGEEFKSHFGNKILLFSKKKKKLSEIVCFRKVVGSLGERTRSGSHATGGKSPAISCSALFIE